jgi:hypothetical protein
MRRIRRMRGCAWCGRVVRVRVVDAEVGHEDQARLQATSVERSVTSARRPAESSAMHRMDRLRASVRASRTSRREGGSIGGSRFPWGTIDPGVAAPTCASRGVVTRTTRRSPLGDDEIRSIKLAGAEAALCRTHGRGCRSRGPTDPAEEAEKDEVAPLRAARVRPPDETRHGRASRRAASAPARPSGGQPAAGR